jgi:hypothetical protein
VLLLVRVFLHDGRYKTFEDVYCYLSLISIAVQL